MTHNLGTEFNIIVLATHFTSHFTAMAAAEQKRGDGDGDDPAFVTPPSRVVAAPPLLAATRRLFFKLCVRPGTGHLAIIRETVRLMRHGQVV